MRRLRLLPAVVLLLALRTAGGDESIAPYSVADTTAARVAIERARVAFAAGDAGRGCDELSRVLLHHREDLIALAPEGSPDDRPQIRYVPAARVALDLLRALPEQDRAVYEEKAGPPARAMLEAAEVRHDNAGLRAVLDLYGATSIGPIAARRLADSLLEAGRPLDAAAAAADGLDVWPLCANLWVRRIDALTAGRDGDALASIVLPPSLETTSIAASGREMTLGERLDAARKKVPPRPPPADVPAWGGGPAHNVRSPWEQALRPLRWAAGTPPATRERDHGSPFPQDANESATIFSTRFPNTAPYFPILSGRSLLVADGFGVESRDVLSGRLVWRYPTPSRHRLADDAVRADSPSLQGRTNLDVAFSACVDDGLVFSTIEVADNSFVPRSLHGTAITTYRPLRVLVAVDALTGEPRWRMGATPADAAALEGVSIGGCPVAADGLVVAVGVKFEKRWVTRVLAFEQKTGRLRWSKDIVSGQQELNLFGEPVKELWAGTPAIADGTVYAPTGLGVFVAISLRTGAVLWMSSYDTIQIARVMVWYETPLRFARWGPSPVIVHGDAVMIAPADGPHLLCFNRRTGVLRWREEAESGPRSAFLDYFLGVGSDGRRDLAITTGGSLRALSLEDGNVAWSSRLAPSAIVRGRGAISLERVYVPTDGGLDVFSLPGEGRLLAPSPAPWPDRSGPGNVLLTPRVLVVSRGLGGDEEEGPVAPIEVFYDPDDIERDIDKRRKANPSDPKPLVELADLWRLVGRDAKADAGYEDAIRAAEAAHDPATADRAREGMILLARDRGDAYTGLGKWSDARSAYETALSRATTAADRIALRLRLDRLFRQANLENAQIRNLASLISEAGNERTTFSPREGEVPARPAARFLLATLHRRAGRTADAVDVLEDVLREDAEAQIAGETAGLRAKRSIDEILTEPAGAAAYRRHEVEADRRLFEASKGTDPQAFERILAEYPNARAVPAALVGLAQRQAAAGKAAAAVVTLSRFLASYSDRPQAPFALALLARTLEASGSVSRARAALSQLERRHGDARFEIDGQPTTGKEFAKAEHARLGAPPPRPAPRPLARSPQERMTERVDTERVGANVIEVEAAADATFSVPALVGVDDDVIAIDPETARVRWRRSLSGAVRGAHAVVAGDAIVIAAGESVAALDPAAGDVRWEQELPGHAIDVGSTLGLTVVLVQTPSAGMTRSSLHAFDPLTGAKAWARDLSGYPVARMLVGADGLAIARRRPDSSGALSVTLYASLTGEPTADLAHSFDGWTDASPQIVDGRRIVGVTRGTDGVRLEAFDMPTGTPAWSTPISGKGAPIVKRQLHVRGGNAIVIDATGALRTFDRATGAAVGETAVTGGLLFIGDRSVVMLDDRLVAIVRERPGRTAIVAFDRRTGRSLWSKDAVTDAQGVSDGVLLDADGVIVAVMSPARPPLIRPTGAMSQPPDYQIAVLSPDDGSAVRISAPGLGDFRPSASLSDGLLVVAGRQRFAAYR